MEEDTAGDPMSHKKWCRKDTRSISEEMKAQGIDICPNSVGKLLKDQDYSLRANRKTIAETYHPDRNQQFEVISQMRKEFEDEGQPIVSVDGKKKELVGNFKNPGKTWRKNDEDVLVHDFRSEASAIASPYGLYEILLNRGAIVVGTSSNTPEFAADCVDLWLNELGWNTYPTMKKLLLLCDSGGSNGCRPRMWKYKLYHQIAKCHGIEVTVCHYPPGASKWNPVEHRLFSFITMEWAGHPLRSVDHMLGYIRGTTTKTGLQVLAFLNSKSYVKGLKVTNSEFNEIPIKRHEVLPNWNYTITPSRN
jgi:hypothetical protein